MRTGVDGMKTISDMGEGESAGQRENRSDDMGAWGRGGRVCTAGLSSLQRASRGEGALFVHSIDVRKLERLCLMALVVPVG